MGLVQHAKGDESFTFKAKPVANVPTAKKATAGAKGTGAKRAKKSVLEVFRLEDPQHALLCPPADYVDCRNPIDVVGDDQISPDAALFKLTFTGNIRGFNDKRAEFWSVPSTIPHLGALGWPKIKATKRTEIEMQDSHGRPVYISFFRVPREWTERKKGEEVLAMGHLKRYGSKLTLDIQKEAPPRAVGTIWPQYAGIPGQIAGERIEIFVNTSIDNDMAHRKCMAVILGDTGKSDAELMDLCGSTEDSGFNSTLDVLRALHRPTSVEEGHLALEYAKRITALGIQASALRHHVRHPHPKAPLAINPQDVDRLIAHLPMPLTKGQRDVLNEAIQRMGNPKPMNALLSGDVGTGKTLAYLIPALAAHLAGYRVAIITPRTLLADQIAKQVMRWDGIARVERVATGGKIKDPSSILVSTHGLTTVADRAGYVPHLLVCDEQHKFSAESREALVAEYTHVLEVSATPVPRSLAAALYEGMEILNLRECPVEKTIFSEVIDMKERGQVIAGIRKTLKDGGIAAMIYPMVNTADGSDAQSVTRAYESLNEAFPNQCVMLHGEMSDDQMRENIDKLHSGERRLVVASTVLEIGIDIPSVTFMAVRDADRFGISQLHQLRGRLVRNGGTGVFMMVVEDFDKTPPQSLERLESVAATSDGYKLAELDLVQRGFGDMDGSAQSGNSATIFRNIKLNVNDFLSRKLKTIYVEPGGRDYNKTENLERERPRQASLM
jgi:ATP-dependent DNA helicase RecG